MEKSACLFLELTRSAKQHHNQV